MNKAGSIAIVAALAAAVTAVIAMKNVASSRPVTQPGGQPATQPAGGLPRLVDLGSTTCIPCKMMTPILDELRAEYAGRLQVEFVDVKENPAGAKPYDIQLIPTQVFFDASGRERWRHEGFIAKDDILAKWKELGVDLGGTGTD
ncbi:MAG: thioredoxin family protein [Planctomycetota bacterium]|nr:thioredoxin family protein [Planctomycetota bacterium]